MSARDKRLQSQRHERTRLRVIRSFGTVEMTNAPSTLMLLMLLVAPTANGCRRPASATVLLPLQLLLVGSVDGVRRGDEARSKLAHG